MTARPTPAATPLSCRRGDRAAAPSSGRWASMSCRKPGPVPNPATQNCLDRGGQHATEQRGDGGEYGVCLFEDNRQCEEWAMARGECPVGGVKVSGYNTSAACDCAITGGNIPQPATKVRRTSRVPAPSMARNATSGRTTTGSVPDERDNTLANERAAGLPHQGVWEPYHANLARCASQWGAIVKCTGILES